MNVFPLKKYWVPTLGAATLVLAAGCNFGGNQVEGGIQGTGFSIGLLTGFGSVYVNGKRFDTTGAEFVVNGITSTESALQKGMLVRVDGEWRLNGEGNADEVVYDDTLRGPINLVNWDGNEFTTGTISMLEQEVTVSSQTVFAGTTRLDLGTNVNVRISGWNLGNGNFQASLVEKINSTDIEVEGVISDLYEAEQTFVINGLKIQYSDTTDFAEGLTLSDGLSVEVEGTLAGGVVSAEEIDFDDQTRFYRGDDGDDIDLSGPITSVNAANNTFVHTGLTIRWDDKTDFEDGLEAADLTEGFFVRVEGEWRNGTLVAEEIEPREADAEVEARVTAIDSDLRQLIVGGVTVQVGDDTLIVDDEDDQRIAFSDLATGDFLEVEGLDRTDGAGNPILRAIQIEREDEDEDVFTVEGRLSAKTGSISGGTLTVLGVTVNVDGDTKFEDKTFDDLEAGDTVEVEYQPDGEGFLAIEVEYDDDND